MQNEREEEGSLMPLEEVKTPEKMGNSPFNSYKKRHPRKSIAMRLFNFFEILKKLKNDVASSFGPVVNPALIMISSLAVSGCNAAVCLH